MMDSATWIEEWRAFRVRCRPRFEEMFDEAEFFERLQDIGGWYLPLGEGQSVIVCVDRDRADERRDEFLAALRRQKVEATIEAEGRGFALREGSRLKSYRIEVGNDVHVGPSEPEVWRAAKERWRAFKDRLFK